VYINELRDPGRTIEIGEGVPGIWREMLPRMLERDVHKRISAFELQ